MIGILGGMGTQAGLDLCNKLSMLYRGKSDQEYPKFILYNKTETLYLLSIFFLQKFKKNPESQE